MQANGNHAGGFVDTSVPDVTAVVGIWYAAPVKWREEKLFAGDLARLGIPHFIPLSHRFNMRKGDKQPVHYTVPFFDGYVFFAGGDNERYAATTTHRVLDGGKVLTEPRQDRFIAKLRATQIALVQNPRLGLYRDDPVGKWCYVFRGPFQGVYGLCLQRRENTETCRVLIEFEFMGQKQVPLEVEAGDIEIAADQLGNQP